MKRLADFVRVMRFRLALIEGDRRLRERIEAAISIHLKNQPDPVGSFQDEGVRYRPRRPSETAI